MEEVNRQWIRKTSSNLNRKRKAARILPHLSFRRIFPHLPSRVQNVRLYILGRTLTRCQCATWYGRSIFFAFPPTRTVGTRRQIINVPIGTNLSTFLSPSFPPSLSPYLLRKIPRVESDLKKTTSLQLPPE